MSYTITITEKKPTTTTVRGDYKELSEEFISQRDYEELEFEERKKWAKHDNGQFRRSIYGYTEPYEKFSIEETKIFEQTTETLDLKSVIKAINGLDGQR